MKRLCIYLTYDSQKIVDGYIGYMLRELKCCVQYLVVVCNQTDVIKGKDMLETYADDIFYRENVGYDAGGFKDALCHMIGWDRTLQYDELLLVNDSMFGPFRPMSEMFEEMNQRNVDFWGMTIHGESESRTEGHIPEHIQSYFLAIGSDMLHDPLFRAYWEEMPYYTSFDETVKQHEVRFTKHFAELGYRYDSLADTRTNDSSNIANNYIQYAMIPYELISKRNFSFLKKKQLALDTLHCQTQENLRQALDYIDKKTDYDVDLIWENIIRTLNMTDLQRSLHLQYILDSDNRKRTIQEKKVLFLVFVQYKEAAESVIEYLGSITEKYLVRVLTGDAGCAAEYEKRGILCEKTDKIDMQRLGRDASGYDFVCMLHDTDMSSEKRFSCIGKSYFYNIWENLVKGPEHIEEILYLFEQKPRLGFLAAPKPNFGEAFGEYGKGWNDMYEAVRHLTEDLGLNCRLSRDKEPFRITNDVWIRGDVLKKLSGLSAADLPCLPYLWIYLAQDAGYFAGIVESADYASMNEVNMQHYLEQMTLIVRSQFGEFENFFGMERQLEYGKLREFCSRYDRIFVYGVGGIAKKYADLIPEIESFLVSDGQGRQQAWNGMPVKCLSEISATDETGIVLCLNRENQEQVIPLLKERGFEHYFCV